MTSYVVKTQQVKFSRFPSYVTSRWRRDKAAVLKEKVPSGDFCSSRSLSIGKDVYVYLLCILLRREQTSTNATRYFMFCLVYSSHSPDLAED